MKAHDVASHLKPGTIVVSDRSVILVVDHGAGDTLLVNLHNGREANYYEWWNDSEEVELYEDLEDWFQAYFVKRPLRPGPPKKERKE